ncbi:MAG: lipopolysaccharide export system protein LptA [Oceanicoccus sp.]|jgi:lipopolysaccharide export system protein LptA
MNRLRLINKLQIQLSTALFAALLPLTAVALPEDSSQPINIQSDRASQKTLANSELIEYFGNVVMTQGSLKITGDHIIINSKQRQVTKIIATGQPAVFEQQSDPAKSPIRASANKLNYKLKTDTVILTKNASIVQDGTTVSGDRIEYNIAAEQVKAEGGNERVTMILTPETADSSDQEPASTNNQTGEKASSESGRVGE